MVNKWGQGSGWWLAGILLMPLAVCADTSWNALLEQAWQRHPLAAGWPARTQEVQAGKALAAAWSPEPAAVSLGHLNDRQGRNQGKDEWELEVAVPLWLPGQQAARQDEAARRIDELEWRRLAGRLEVAGEVREAWWAVAAARSAWRLSVQRLETAGLLLNSVRQRFKVGDLSRIDANLAEGEHLAAEEEVLASERAVHQAEQAFLLLTGQAAPADLPEEQPAPWPGEAGALANQHPQLLAEAAALNSARARFKVVEETRRAAPELALRWVRDRNDQFEPYGNQVGFRLKIPFSSGAQVQRDRSLAEVELDQADRAVLRREMQLQQNAEQARRQWRTTDGQLERARRRSQLAADSRQLAEKAFALGEIDLAALLRLRNNAHEAESALARLQIARAAAVSSMNQVLGVLP